jgi:nitrogen fixation protein FixH
MTQIAILRRDRLIPWYFALGMGIVIFANACLIYFAVSTWSGLSADRAYQRGLAFNRAIAAAERQDALGWSVDLTFGNGTGNREVSATAINAEGMPLEGLEVRVDLSRPVGPADTRSLTLQADGGRYVGALEAMPRGQWDAKIEARRDGNVWRSTQRIVVQ